MNKDDILIIGIIIIVGVASFAFGRFSVTVDSTAASNPAPVKTGTVVERTEVEEPFVASVNGTRYYYIWCSGASRINEENKTYFKSKEEAEGAGYTKAANCEGL